MLRCALIALKSRHAAIAASYFTKPAHLVGIIGKDFPQEHLDLLESRGATLDGLERSSGDSFTCEAFSTRRLQEITRADIEARLGFLQAITHWP